MRKMRKNEENEENIIKKVNIIKITIKKNFKAKSLNKGILMLTYKNRQYKHLFRLHFFIK